MRREAVCLSHACSVADWRAKEQLIAFNNGSIATVPSGSAALDFKHLTALAIESNQENESNPT